MSEEKPLLGEEADAAAVPTAWWWPLASSEERERVRRKSSVPSQWVDVQEQRVFSTRGVVLANAMGLCGVVLAVLGSTLGRVARQCGTTATGAGTVFLARGLGSVAGAIVSLVTYSALDERRTRLAVVAAQLGLALGMVSLTLVTSVSGLHALWGLIGACTATLDTGVQIATLESLHKDAPFWLATNTVAFCVAGAVVQSVQIGVSSIKALNGGIAIVCVVNAAALARAPYVNFRPGLGMMPLRRAVSGLEWLFATICFLLIGGHVDATSYITTYIHQSHVVPRAHTHVILMTLWAALVVGRLVGFRGQLRLIEFRSEKVARTVAVNLVAWLCVAAFGTLLILAASSSRPIFWIGIALYGLGNGPSVGFCYDLVQRVADTTVLGLTVVMLGLNLGCSIVPFATATAWQITGSPRVLIFAMLACVLVPLPLILVSPAVLRRSSPTNGLFHTFGLAVDPSPPSSEGNVHLVV